VGLSFVQRINPAWFLAAAAFFLPIKPAPVNLFLALALVFIFIGAKYRQQLLNNFKRKELLPLWVLLFFLALTYFFPSNNPSNYQEFLSKYGRLILVPVLACALVNQVDREIVGKGFLAGVALVLFLSYAIWLGIDPALFGVEATTMSANAGNPTVFKAHITHNFFLVIAIYFWINAALKQPRSKFALLYTGLLLLALWNLFGMIDGRTGWLVFMVLPLFYGYRLYGLKGLCIAGVVFVMLLVAAYFLVGNVNERISMGILEMEQLLASVPKQGTSIGERVMYLTSSWSAFLQAPLLGYGLGGVENAVEPYTTAAAWPSFHNPHNQYLMFLVQGGVVALFVYLVFYGNLVYQSASSAWSQVHILPVLLVYLVGNMLNSFHFDFSEGVGFVLLVAAYVATLNNSEMKSAQ